MFWWMAGDYGSLPERSGKHSCRSRTVPDHPLGRVLWSCIQCSTVHISGWCRYANLNLRSWGFEVRTLGGKLLFLTGDSTKLPVHFLTFKHVLLTTTKHIINKDQFLGLLSIVSIINNQLFCNSNAHCSLPPDCCVSLEVHFHCQKVWETRKVQVKHLYGRTMFWGLILWFGDRLFSSQWGNFT